MDLQADCEHVTERSGDSERGCASLVVCFDAVPERRQRVLEALARASVPAVGAGDFAALERSSAAAAVLVVAVSPADPLAPSEQADCLRHYLTRALELGVRTIGYATGVGPVALERRCEYLLAGIELVLDSAAPEFADELLTFVAPAVARHRVRREEERRIDMALSDVAVVATASSMRCVLRRVVRLAELSSCPVLLQGESGTGKEIAAKILHACDPKRAGAPFVPVNCAALSKTLAESELFGHRRGAFSGAMQERPGLLRAAEGGVLFLDEIGELDHEVQGKLLRVIQEGRVLALGDDRERPIDVRIVAATHRDLSALVDAGRFRLDLFHRLSVVAVHLPPLRERHEDIAPLARHFARKHMPPNAGAPPTLGQDFLDALGRMHLRGNVRELENLVRAALAGRDHAGTLGLSDLPRAALREIAESQPPGPVPALESRAAPRADWNLARALDSCERSLILAALATSKGNQVAAARLLGVTPRTVFNKVRRHGLKAHCG